MADYRDKRERRVDKIGEGEPVDLKPLHEDEEEELQKPVKEEEQAVSIFAALSSIFKKIFSIFSDEKIPSGYSLTTSEELTEKATNFCNELSLLLDSDLSRSVPFSERLSTAWALLTLTVDIASRFKVELSVDVSALSQVIDEIKTYPKGASHTLGYYLTAHAGEEWLPFPYMEMLQELHAHPDTHLRKWIDTITNSLD